MKLLPALDASERQLRRDECGAWNIMGRWGHISVMSQSYHLVCFTDECDLDPDINPETGDSAHRSARRWESAKRRLSFCPVVQDGDAEGILDLEGLPTPEQAIEIRDIMGIRKRRDLSDEDRERLAAQLRGFRSGPDGESSSDN